MINHRLTFIGDTTSRMVEIRTIEDETFEEPETFVVLITLITLLSGPGMAKVDNRRSNITVTIDDDDPQIRGRRKFNNSHLPGEHVSQRPIPPVGTHLCCV